jgi:hypothetical protein
LKNEYLVKFEETYSILDTKVDKDTLNMSEKAIMDKIHECITALMIKMADKNETKKALIFLEKRIN